MFVQAGVGGFVLLPLALARCWTGSPLFDVIIIDEASQCGVEALPLFYLGRKYWDRWRRQADQSGCRRVCHADAVHRLMEELLILPVIV